jgi:transposase
VKARHPGHTVEVWFQDEARFGQQGTLTHVWAEKGSRPIAIKQTEYEWVYLFAAVNPVTGESSALLAPTVNTDLMNAHLEMISKQVRCADDGRHVVLVLDQAGWHVAKALNVPGNITLMHLPPYSPELNPVERLWLYLRNHYLSNRLFADEDNLWNACRNAWNRIEPDRFNTICNTQWIKRCN